MAKFSETFHLPHGQASLDFVDIDTSRDTQLYLDPYAIEIRDDQWSTLCADHIRSFFSEVLEALRADNRPRAAHLLGNLHEPNETCLGQSRGRPSGRGVGSFKAGQFAEALRDSRAFATGLLTDISEAELFIAGIGSDTISDLTTNILRGVLADYTKEQCDLYNIPTAPVRSLGPVWNMQTNRWEAKALQLPRPAGRPVLLVPKFSVRFRMSLDSQEFYNHHMIEFLRAEHLAAGSGLVHTLKNGDRKVYKKDVKAINEYVKDDLATFVRNHPEVLEEYKRIKGADGALSANDLEKFFDEAAFAQALINRLQRIAAGNAAAGEYHSIALGICTFLFHPGLICPVKEREIHDGRKRIDIKFTNAAKDGFFFRMMAGPQTRALSVAVECKNYTKEINNPELDQMTGRFGHQRGFFGIVLCRSVDNRDRLTQRCKDAANDSRGYVLVLDDADLINMLGMVQSRRRMSIDRFLADRFDEISH